MENIVSRFERIVSVTLIIVLMLFIAYQILVLLWSIVESFSKRFNEVGLEYAPEYARTLGILFFNILLLLEIMETIKVFSKHHIIKVRVILIVCLIATGRKILALDSHDQSPMNDIGVAALILTLSVGYFLVSKSNPHLDEMLEKNQNSEA